MNIRKLGMILLLLLVLTSASFAAEIMIYERQAFTDNPSPTISITYSEEEDAPLVLIEHQIFNALDLDKPLEIGGKTILGDAIGNFKHADSIKNKDVHIENNAYDQYIFNVNSFLPTGKYKIFIDAEKYHIQGGPEHNTVITLDVEADTIDMWIVQPRINFIEEEDEIINAPDFKSMKIAIDDSLSFDLEIATEFPASCSIGKNLLTSSDDTCNGGDDDTCLEKKYNDGKKFNDNLDQTTTHKILAWDKSLEGTDSKYTSGGDSIIIKSFDYENYLDSSFIVTCAQKVLGKIEYHQEIIYVGHDLSDPVIEANFTPYIIEDPGNMDAELNISSVEDFIVCKYKFIPEIPDYSITGKKEGYFSTLFNVINNNLYDVAGFGSKLLKNHVLGDELVLGGHDYEYKKSYEFKTEVVCSNLAGKEVTLNPNFFVNLTNELKFFVDFPTTKIAYDDTTYNYDDVNSDIIVRTNLEAKCTVKYGNDLVHEDEFLTRDHEFNFDIGPDNYDVILDFTCEMKDSNTGVYALAIAKDTQEPTTPIFEQRYREEENFDINEIDYTCDGSISTKILAPNNEYETVPYGLGDNIQYNYTLFDDQGKEIASGLSTYTDTGIDLTLDVLGQNNIFNMADLDLPSLAADMTYTWKVFATDGSGKISEVAEQTVRRLHNNNEECDTQSPTATHEALFGMDGYKVTISCSDTENNCAEEFYYGRIPFTSELYNEDLSANENCANLESDLSMESLNTIITFSEDSLLCYKVFDTAKPTQHNSSLIPLEITPGINIKLITPPTGIHDKPQFDFTIETISVNAQRDLDCNQGPYSILMKQLYEEKDYAGMYNFGFTQKNFATSNGKTHSTPFNAYSSTGLGNTFDGAKDTDIQEWVIVCKEEGIELYPTKTILLGFDKSAPKITLITDPLNLVENPVNMNIVLMATTDDNSYCTYHDINNDEENYFNFDQGIYQIYETYGTQHDSSILYNTQEPPKDVMQEVICTNLAGITAKETINYRVEASGDVVVEILMDEYYSQKKIDFQAKTQGQWATCHVGVDGVIPLEEFDTTSSAINYIHEHQITLEEGEHNIYVNCESNIGLLPGNDYSIVTVDLTAPDIFSDMNTVTCSSNTITATFNADETQGSPIITKTYKLKNRAGTILSEGAIGDDGEKLILANLPLVLGEDYYFEIFSEDTVGHSTTQNSQNILAATQEHSACDFVNPTGDASSFYSYGQINIDVTCDDGDGVGCTDYYYYFLDETGVCNYEGVDLEIGTYGLSVEATQSATLCYQVYDEALNVYEGTYDFEVIQSCSNGIQDEETGETGVDCGGNCPLSADECNICYNEEHDELWESSTDCGMQCRTICDETGMIPLLIEIKTPKHGVSQTRDFTLTIETNRNAECRFKEHDPQYQLGAEDLYKNYMTSPYYNQNFESSYDGKTHTIEIDGDTFSENTGLAEYVSQIMIVCKDYDSYKAKVIDPFGFDTTPPTFIDVWADPNPVDNILDLTTLLQATTNEETICHYTDKKHGTDEAYTQELFSGNDYDITESYSITHEQVINYQTQEAHMDEQTISCTNYAGLTSYFEPKLVIELAPEYSQDITILNDGKYYNQDNGDILLEVETNAYVSCSYRLLGELEFTDMDIDNTDSQILGLVSLAKRHTKIVTVEDGTHHVEVLCDNLLISREMQVASFTQDHIEPVLDITLFDKTCSLTSINMDITEQEAPSDIAELTFSVFMDGNAIIPVYTFPAQWSSVFQPNIELNQYLGKEIEVVFEATDSAGNKARFNKFTTVSEDTHPLCDNIDPVMDSTLEVVWGGYDLTVSCTDNIACNPNYDYTFATDGNCEEVYNYWPLDTSNTFTESGTICFKVKDERPNYSPLNTTNIIINPSCSNHVWNEGEEDVDCGGVCEISCEDLDCENGVKDIYEDGIDCGASCAASCGECVGDSCTCYNDVMDGDETGFNCGGSCISCEEKENLPLDIILKKPRFGISDSKNFTLEVYTTQPATCKHGYLANVRPTNISTWYTQLENSLSDNLGELHTTKIISDETLLLPREQSLTYFTTEWVVICKDDNDEYIVEEIIPFGFDLSPANIFVSATPNPIIDPGNRTTLLRVSSDDPVACTYMDKNGNTHYFNGVNINDSNTYIKESKQELRFNGIDNYSQVNTISCKNIAQAYSEKNITISVALTNEVGITSNMKDAYNTDDILISAKTQILSLCSYKLEGEENYTTLTSSGAYVHEKSIDGFDEGEHYVDIYCQSASSREDGEISIEFLVDKTVPTITLEIPTQSCGLDSISFSILADGTGSDIDLYEYTVTQGNETIAEDDTTSSLVYISENIEEGITYTIEVTVYDEAGNNKTAKDTMTGAVFDPLTCDTTSPRGSLKINGTWNGVEVTILCSDSDSNCTDTFEYELSESGICTDNTQTGKYDEDLPLVIKESTTLCYTVHDEANNKDENSREIVYTPHCFNQIEDPNEDGVDCGNTCLAECGTCDNEIKDQYEDGVDCGGVCLTVTGSCDDIGTLYGDDDTSFLDEDEDGLPDDWEYDNFGDLDEDADGDYDYDGITNGEEYENGTDPTTYTPGGVIIDEDEDGLPDGWEMEYFGTLAQGADDDQDEDEISNLEEYRAGTDPTIYNEQNECDLDEDCKVGFVCDYTYKCVEDIYSEDNQFDEVKGTNIWGILLIILGLLSMGGGIGYIYYSRKQLAEKEAASKKLSSSEIASRKAAQLAQQKKNDDLAAAAHAKRRAAQEKARQERLDARKKQRESLIGTFDKKAEPESTNIFGKQAPKEPSKLDDGFDEDYVDVRKLGKGAENKPAIKKGLAKETNKDVFESLAKLSKPQTTSNKSSIDELSKVIKTKTSKAPVKKTPTKAAPAKKTPTKKTPAKKTAKKKTTPKAKSKTQKK